MVYLNDMIDNLFTRSTTLDLLPLVHVFEQLRSHCLGDGIVEIGADIGSTVRAVLLAKVLQDSCSSLFGRKLDLGLGFFLGRRHVLCVLGSCHRLQTEEMRSRSRNGQERDFPSYLPFLRNFQHLQELPWMRRHEGCS